MANKDHGPKQLIFLGIAIFAATLLAYLFESGKGNWFIYLAGTVVGGVGVFGFFRPDLVDLDIN